MKWLVVVYSEKNCVSMVENSMLLVLMKCCGLSCRWIFRLLC